MSTEILEILYDQETIGKRIRELATQLNIDYQNKCPLVICVLKGAVMFFADLTRQMTIPLELDFVAASSYGTGSTSSGQVKITHEPSTSIEGRHVILIEDMVETGHTLSELVKLLEKREPASIKVVALCDKPSRRTVGFSANYIGFEVKDAFIVGTGMDYAGKYRNLPYLAVVKPPVCS